jgi:hypothetical protein
MVSTLLRAVHVDHCTINQKQTTFTKTRKLCAPASCMVSTLPRAVHVDHSPSSCEVRASKMYAHNASTGAASWFNSTCKRSFKHSNVHFEMWLQLF